MSTSASLALSTKPLPLHSLCYLEISLMAHGKRSPLITSPIRVESTHWYVICSASTPSYIKFPPNLLHSIHMNIKTKVAHCGNAIKAINEVALSHLHLRLQVRTLNNVSIPLPPSDEVSSTSSDSDEQESPTAEAEAGSAPAQRSYHQQADQMMDSPCRPGEEAPPPEMPDSSTVESPMKPKIPLTSPMREPRSGKIRCESRAET